MLRCMGSQVSRNADTLAVCEDGLAYVAHEAGHVAWGEGGNCQRSVVHADMFGNNACH